MNIIIIIDNHYLLSSIVIFNIGYHHMFSLKISFNNFNHSLTSIMMNDMIQDYYLNPLMGIDMIHLMDGINTIILNNVSHTKPWCNRIVALWFHIWVQHYKWSWSPGAHYTENLWTCFPNLVKKKSAFPLKTTIQSGHKFAHATTAQLSWHVQSCGVIRSLEWTIEYFTVMG